MKDFSFAGKDAGGGEGDRCSYPFRLDTYGSGCQHDCSYCYAKSLLDFRKLWDPRHPAVTPIKAIDREIRKLHRGDIVRLGGMTDCFQPCEWIYRNTYKTIMLLNRRRVGYLIVTKSAMVADYADIMDRDLAHIQITVTTLDDKLAATYEKASPPTERVKAILKLQDLGFDVQLRLSPYIPEYMDTEKLNDLGVDKACVEFLRVNTWIRRWFDIDYSEYTLKQGGYEHMPLEKKKEYLKRLTGFRELTVCEDEDEAYEYWRENVNPNREDCCNLRR